MLKWFQHGIGFVYIPCSLCVGLESSDSTINNKQKCDTVFCPSLIVAVANNVAGVQRPRAACTHSLSLLSLAAQPCSFLHLKKCCRWTISLPSTPYRSPLPGFCELSVIMSDEAPRKRSRFDQTEPEPRKPSRFDRRSRSPSNRQSESRRSRSPTLPKSPPPRDTKSASLDPAAAAGKHGSSDVCTQIF